MVSNLVEYFQRQIIAILTYKLPIYIYEFSPPSVINKFAHDYLTFLQWPVHRLCFYIFLYSRLTVRHHKKYVFQILYYKVFSVMVIIIVK